MKAYRKNIKILFLVLLSMSCSKDDSPTQPLKSSAKQLISFVFKALDNSNLEEDITATIDQNTKTITAQLPTGTDITALVPSVQTSPKASITPTGARDFSNEVTYTVTAEDGSKATYSAQILRNASSENQILSVVFLSETNSALTINVTAIVDEDTKTITATMPRDTDVKVLLPTLEVSTGASVSPEGARNFTSGVNYTITAEDGSVATYELILDVLTDMKILILLYDANPGNILEWDITDSDIGTWKGVTTNSDGYVTDLKLESSELTVLPPEFGQLYNLMNADFDRNNISAIPPEIGQLQSLNWLDLNQNELISLPPEIGMLTNLDFLSLFGNDLTSIPPELGQLDKLVHLDLSKNGLTSLPDAIGQLGNLKMLRLEANQLVSLPSGIGQLTMLESLFIRNNKVLNSLPPEIGQLSNLVNFPLSGCALTTLPPEIGQLGKLEILELDDNQLISVPPEMGQLTALENLDLSNNSLTGLPREFGQLTGLNVLKLDGNDKITALPMEVCDLDEANGGSTRIFISQEVVCFFIPDIRSK